MKNLLYIGESIGIPNTAMNIHCRNLSKIFQALDYNVSFVCLFDNQDDVLRIPDDEYTYFYSVKKHNNGITRKIESFREAVSGNALFSAFLRAVNLHRPDIILYYGYSAETKLLKYANKHNIPIYIERVDWFEKEDRKGFYQKYIEQGMVDRAYDRLDLQANGVIAISNYIESYFVSRNQNVLKIPPVFDVISDEISYYKKGNPIRLCYCGSLGNNKDYLFPIIESLLDINESSIRFSFDIIGVSEIELSKHYQVEKLKNSGIVIHGRLDNALARCIIKKCDFSFLLRDRKRYAKAGFSTKFAESMMLGVPVICNRVGGADSIIKENVTGIIIESHSKDNVRDILNEILCYDENRINDIKLNTFEFAHRFFDYHSYIELLDDFISKTK